VAEALGIAKKEPPLVAWAWSEDFTGEEVDDDEGSASPPAPPPLLLESPG